MDLRELLNTIGDKVQTRASVKTIIGDPIEAEGKTIVPIARVAYGFGAGGADGEESGGGGGGGVGVSPVGVLEITPEATRFIPIGTRRRLLVALALGVAAGFLVGRLGIR